MICVSLCNLELGQHVFITKRNPDTTVCYFSSMYVSSVDIDPLSSSTVQETSRLHSSLLSLGWRQLAQAAG